MTNIVLFIKYPVTSKMLTGSYFGSNQVFKAKFY